MKLSIASILVNHNPRMMKIIQICKCTLYVHSYHNNDKKKEEGEVKI